MQGSASFKARGSLQTDKDESLWRAALQDRIRKDSQETFILLGKNKWARQMVFFFLSTRSPASGGKLKELMGPGRQCKMSESGSRKTAGESCNGRPAVLL